MYNDLIDCLKKCDYYCEKAIKDFHKTNCRSSEKMALDFNQIKTRFCKEEKQNLPKSVNAIKFSNNKLYFIDMVSYYFTNPLSPENFVKVQSAEDGIKVRILGTLKILFDIIKFCKLNSSFNTFFSDASTRKINTILLSEMNDQDYLKMKLSNLNIFNIPADTSEEGEIAIINCEQFEKLF